MQDLHSTDPTQTYNDLDHLDHDLDLDHLDHDLDLDLSLIHI